jgi:uncharacterized membrane protein YoaK (UPF0700 family)
MFIHQGTTRTFKHNLRIASVLSFVAGIVNVVGFLSIQRLTTNVTGHFAYFIDDVFKLNFLKGTVYFIYIISFLLGSFVSSTLIEVISKAKKYNIYVLPVVLESFTLLFVIILAKNNIENLTDFIACSLLFAMGVQNSFVTRISNAVVRTTHLTGLFTDLGIELSQLLFREKNQSNKSIVATIKLRLIIISFFFFGGIIGVFLYSKYNLYTLIFPAIILILGLMFDNFRYRLILIKRKFLRKNSKKNN